MALDLIKVKEELLKELEKFTVDSDRILFTPEGEDAIFGLLDMQSMIENAVSEAKTRIEESALKINPDFTAVVGMRIKVGYQYFGARFDVIPGMEEQIPQDFVEKKVSYRLKPKEVELYEKEHGEMPEGVVIRERKKSITFKLKGEVEYEA